METRKHCKIMLVGSFESKQKFINPLMHLDEYVNSAAKKGLKMEGVPAINITVNDAEFRIWDWNLIGTFQRQYVSKNTFAVVVLYLDATLKIPEFEDTVLHFETMNCSPLECVKRIQRMTECGFEVKTSIYNSSAGFLFPAKDEKVEVGIERSLRKSC